MSDAYQKLIKTLRTVFEMDKADLDFGIYRILNQKRTEMTQFLEKDLLPEVKKAFADYTASSKVELETELAQALKQAEHYGAPDPQQTPMVREAQAKLATAVDMIAVENEVYSHLHTFFSRYYDKGDFISQRRYKANTYAIPYEGEEVKLYWANHDQYYIKSSERLRDYAFTVQGHDGKTVRIKLVEADTEKDNVKAKADEERRFVLDKDQPLSVDGDELQIRFHYVPTGKKTQDALNQEAVDTVFAQTAFQDWLVLLQSKAPTEKNPKRTLLEKHLNDYTARHTFDYFIHKDLGGFLRRELDFYIKNEVLYLDDIDDAAFAVTEQHLRKIKVIRVIALKLIRMLAQLEDFQKKLWLKKKFVVETQYCITLDRVPEALYPEIAANQDRKST
ncbi:MAG: adenine-specific DNA-methyltransferase, partial [Pseudomonadota bacterium]|nr:adenine-specific DNA-methyltransferase [Pseudomonadota bacterium]